MSHKILHTSDWHLGKKLFKRSRLEEQKLFLNWLRETISSESVDFLIIAGDIFDTPTPPNDALELYFDFLETVSNTTNVHIIIISGNHDSANFIQAPGKILARHNIHIKTRLDVNLENNIISIIKDDVEFLFKCLPYFRSYELYQFIEENRDITPADIEKILKDFSHYWPKPNTSKQYKTLIGHHAFGDFSATGSEHIVSVMGIESLSLNWFSQFDYMALGHIHKTQKMSKTQNIYYCGSPIPLRFSEQQSKNVLLVNTENKEVQKLEIPVFREIIQLNSDESSIMADLKATISSIQAPFELEAFIEIKLQMNKANTELIDDIYNLAQLSGHQILSLIPIFSENNLDRENFSGVNDLSISDLFEMYYKEKYPDTEEIPVEIKDEFNLLLEEINSEIP